MTNDHTTILNFLNMLGSAKGEPGRVSLWAEHGKAQTGESRSVIYSRGFAPAGTVKAKGIIPAGTGQTPQEVQTSGKANPNQDKESASLDISESDGQLCVGELCTFHGISPLTGYVHLFDLGSGGTCAKLAPSLEYPDNQVLPGVPFHLPSERLLAASHLPQGSFVVLEPATETSGQPERLLVIITREDIDIQLEDLHPDLKGRDLLTRCPTRGPGFSGPVRSERPKLFQLNSASWEYGLLEMEVLAAD